MPVVALMYDINDMPDVRAIGNSARYDIPASAVLQNKTGKQPATATIDWNTYCYTFELSCQPAATRVSQPRDLWVADAATEKFQGERLTDSMRWYRQGI